VKCASIIGDSFTPASNRLRVFKVFHCRWNSIASLPKLTELLNVDAKLLVDVRQDFDSLKTLTKTMRMRLQYLA
jgi:hypothetical protein